MKSKLFSWTKNFLWEREDGTMFEVDASVSLLLSFCPPFLSPSQASS